MFAMFREALLNRFPGLFIPPMPPKKKLVTFKNKFLSGGCQGNKEGTFIDERMHFLDRFMKDITLLPYLYESVEF